MKISPMNPYLGSSSTQTYEKVLKGNFPKETFQVTIPKHGSSTKVQFSKGLVRPTEAPPLGATDFNSGQGAAARMDMGGDCG